jgi:hypothetical protein
VSKSAARAQLSVLDVRALDFPMTVWLLTAGLPSGLEVALTAFADSLQRRLAPKRSRK